MEGSYTAVYIAQTPLEPRAAVAEWDAGKLTVWTGTQRPFGVRRQLTEAFSIPEDRVRVIMSDTGSGYSGSIPVKLRLRQRVWQKPWVNLSNSCGDALRSSHKFDKVAGLIEVQSGVKADGTLTAWEYHNYNSGRSAIRTPLRLDLS